MQSSGLRNRNRILGGQAMGEGIAESMGCEREAGPVRVDTVGDESARLMEEVLHRDNLIRAHDRLIQQALLRVLTPIFDPTFSESSFGFRPGRSAHDAVLSAREHMRAGFR